MRSKVLLLSALLHGAGITCAVVAVHAAPGKARPAPRLLWTPSRAVPPEPWNPRRFDPVHREDPGALAAEPEEPPVEDFDPRAFAPAPERAPPPPPAREALPVPDVRVRPPESPGEDVEPEEPVPAAENEPRTAPSEAAYVEARALDSENEPPGYPRRARLMGWEGEVHVEVSVGADGSAAQVRLAKGCRYPVLNREALRAVREWRFSPALRGGRPEPSVILVPVEFRLR